MMRNLWERFWLLDWKIIALAVIVTVTLLLAPFAVIEQSNRIDPESWVPMESVEEMLRHYEAELSHRDKEIGELSQELYLKDLSETLVEMEYAGEFKLTGYCPCEICCGNWAKDRPIIDSRVVVITSGRSFAEEGVTVAIDPDLIPYGTRIYIEGIGIRIAQDSGSKVKGQHVDVYFRRHEDARKTYNEGVNVWIIKEGGEK